MTFMEQWGPSIALMAVSIIIGAVWHKIILEPLSKLVEKTETLVDDYIISAISKPGKYCIWMYGLYKSLDLAGYNEAGITMVMRGAFLICMLWFAFRLADYEKNDSGQSENEYEGFIHYLLKTRNVEYADTIANMLSAVIRMIICLLGFAIICYSMGYDISAFVASLSIGTAALAFAAKDLFGNIFASLIILMDAPFREKEWIASKDVEGIVEKITLRSTSIRTLSGELVYVPSSVLTNGMIINRSRNKKRRILLTVKLALENNSEDIRKIINEINDYLRKDEDIIHEESSIRVYLKEMTATSYDLEVLCFTEYVDYMNAKKHTDAISDVNLFIADTLKKHDIKLAFEGSKAYINYGDANNDEKCN